LHLPRATASRLRSACFCSFLPVITPTITYR